MGLRHEEQKSSYRSNVAKSTPADTRTKSRPGRGGQSIAPDFSPGNPPTHTKHRRGTGGTARYPAAPAIHHPAQYPSESPAPPQSKSPNGATDLLPWAKRDARLRRANTRSPWIATTNIPKPCKGDTPTLRWAHKYRVLSDFNGRSTKPTYPAPIPSGGLGDTLFAICMKWDAEPHSPPPSIWLDAGQVFAGGSIMASAALP